MNPTKAVLHLIARDWSEMRIARAVGVSQPTINKIRRGSGCRFKLGMDLIKLAEKHKGK